MEPSSKLDPETEKTMKEELGEHVVELMSKFVAPLSSDSLRSMVLDVDRYLLVLRETKLSRSFIDTDLADRIASACMDLLKKCDPSDEKRTALVVGAVRYFIYPFDVTDDVNSPNGLLDDAAVVNFVIRHTGLDVPLVKI